MSAVDTLRKAQAAIADDSTDAAKLVAKAIEELADEAGTRKDRIEDQRVRLMQVGEVLKCLAVALDEEADVETSDVVELVADIVLEATYKLDSAALKRKVGGPPVRCVDDSKPQNQRSY